MRQGHEFLMGESNVLRASLKKNAKAHKGLKEEEF
jgi:hypothetical protein